MANVAHAPFIHRFRVRYSEVDPQSVVFNARYLDYADIMITEFFRSRELGFFGQNAVEFHVAHAEVDFHAPIRADEMIEGRHIIARFGNSSMEHQITLHGVDDPQDSQPRAKITIINVHVDLETGRSQPISKELREQLTGPSTRASGESEHG